MITAIAQGEAVIKVTADDTANGTISDSVVVEVVNKSNSPEAKVEKIELANTSVEWSVGDTGSVSYTITPSDATNQGVSWSSSDSAVASVDSATGFITAIAQGEAIIKVTADDTANGTISDSVVVKVVNKKFSLGGVLLDSDGEPLIGYKVTLQSTPRTVITDGEGRYIFDNVEIGDHTLTIENTDGEKVKVFSLKVKLESKFAWSEKDSSISVDVANETAVVDIQIYVDDNGEVTIEDINSEITNPETGDNMKVMVWMAFALLILVGAAFAYKKFILE